MKPSILIIDDEQQLRKLLARIISLEGFNVLEADSLRSADKVLEHHAVELILSDVRLPDGNGVEYIPSLKKRFPSTEIILLTAFGNIPDSVQAIKNGAFDYIVKGDENNRIIPLLYQALEKVQTEKKTAIKINSSESGGFGTVIGKDPRIIRAIELAKKVASTDATVLLLGETGTGKEVFANAIHQNSKRAKKSMVAINCSAFTKDLLEAELFGHKQGAFTGATKDKEGLVEVANGGTLFLDEIGELPPDLQAKLLRFLENGEFIKLGDTKTSKVNTRIIAATNRDLEKEIEQGHFREDLYYRLNVFLIHLPALRERQNDIPLLTEQFLQQLAPSLNRSSVTMSTEAMQLLKKHNWRGNIRELKNILQRAIVLADGDQILPEDLPLEMLTGKTTNNNSLSLFEVEKQHIRKTLAFTNGNKTRAAQLLGIGLATLYRKMEEYKLSK
jgi:two-component system NtrC family response regulator